MESFRIERESGRAFQIRVEEVPAVTPDLVQTLIDIDLQTFAEPTFSHYTATAFFANGRVFLLRADDVVIGTCVCMRTWERPTEVSILSMGIRPGWRGRGLGQRFVSGVLERLRSRGLRSVTLLVGRQNRRAIKVYQDVGFQIVGESAVRVLGAVVGPAPEDGLLTMRVRLSDEVEVIDLSR
jgi:ribosomal protein S18 acetylase RimI-like enzyme